MESQLYILCAALVLIAILLLYHGYVSPKHALPLPPGPPRLPIIGNAHQVPFDFQEETFARWARRYGDVLYLRILQKEIIVLNSLRAARDLLEKRGFIYSDRPRFVMFCELVYSFHPNFSLMPYGDRWRRHRKWYQGSLQARVSLNAFQPVQEREAKIFLQSMLKTPKEFVAHINRYAGAVLLEIGYGYLDDEYVDMAEKVSTGVFETGGAGSTIVDFFPILKYLPTWMPGAGFKRNALKIQAMGEHARTIAFSKVKEDMAAGIAKPSFVRNILEEIAEPTEEDEFELKGAAALLYGAGTDTTVTTMTAFVLAMVCNPEVFAKAQAEMDAVIGNTRLPNHDDRALLPYLESVLKEVYRWSAAVPLSLPHRLMEDDEYRGYRMPGGAMVVPNIWAMTRDEEMFPDPESFRPERFEKLRGDNNDPVDPRMIIFGFGRRICPGRFLADASVWLAFASMVATLNIRRAHDSSGKEIMPPADFVSGTVKHPKPFKCDIRPRTKHAADLILAEARSA
ncbi:cytochrome P450 [Laetiporus sulphureus 93-53]|uniref:Cytochrome P450 n=1 Tax=Laetiporus sulphureus 93-53 TaxID=1314785 RepID=A0A165CPW0_9APHY|nr:cytochrome P450 [Laetiporus sulphureus 93-53]KZT03203.1 cytochrome P450 [Laetiporus sulphureus 93-53]